MSNAVLLKPKVELSYDQETFLNVITQYTFPNSIYCPDLLVLFNAEVTRWNNENPFSVARELLKDTRELRSLKEELLDLGYPIGSDNEHGYYFIPKPAIDGNNAIDLTVVNYATKEHTAKAAAHHKRAKQTHDNVFTFYNLPPVQMRLSL